LSASDVVTLISRNLAAIHDEIAAACGRVGRSEKSVRLIAVTKYAEWAWVEILAGLHQVFGENRPQQLAKRQQQLPQCEWHLIGQLQSNKVRMAVRHAAMIHSVDSLALLEKLNDVARQAGSRPGILLQVNTSGEISKSGFAPESLIEVWPQILATSTELRIDGLMTMAPESPDPENARPTFRRLALLRDQLTEITSKDCESVRLRELSMGMSGDFVVAVEEGATLVRIGSRIFDGLEADTR
jgi:pyridoxal phosphate enzyme (YggS family)